MTDPADPSRDALRKSMLLACEPERAWSLLTEHAGLWWPADRRHTKDPTSRILLLASGEFTERATSGHEVALGRVLEYDAPRRLVLDWYPGTGPDAPTRVVIELVAVPGGTRVDLEHAAGPAGEDLYRTRVSAYDRSWDLVLAAWSAFSR